MSDRPIINVDEAQYADFGGGGRYQVQLARVSSQLGARKLGYNLVRLQPGKVAWPYHFHHGNEEMFVILDGAGKMRYGDTEHPLRTGDIVACPPGAGAAHQIINDSDAELRYLAISTQESPEVAEYPDTGKYGVFVASPPGGDNPMVPLVRQVFPGDAGVDYWAGEDLGADED